MEIHNWRRIVWCLSTMPSHRITRTICGVVSRCWSWTRSLCVVHTVALRNPAEVKTGTPPIFCPAQRISLKQESYDDDDDDEKPVRILLDNEEVHDLLSRLLLSQPTQPTLTNDLMNYVVSISGGHAGSLAGLLETIILDPVNIHFWLQTFFCT